MTTIWMVAKCCTSETRVSDDSPTYQETPRFRSFRGAKWVSQPSAVGYGCGSKIKPPHRRFNRPWFHVLVFHFEYLVFDPQPSARHLFLTHCHIFRHLFLTHRHILTLIFDATAIKLEPGQLCTTRVQAAASRPPGSKGLAPPPAP